MVDMPEWAGQLLELIDNAPGKAVLIRLTDLGTEPNAEPSYCVETLARKPHANTLVLTPEFGYGEHLPRAVELCRRMQVERTPVQRPQPGDQCDDTCTADCGHCKGAGR